VRLADAHNDLRWAFEIRLDIIRDEKETSRCIESIPAFSWILDVCEENPELFNDDSFLWEYKWMLSSVRRNSGVSMSQIETIYKDFKVRLKENGYSLRSYYTAKAHLAFFINDLGNAEFYIKSRNKELKDEMSNCPACELDDEIELELRKGNFDNAIALTNTMTNKKLTCDHMPFACYCNCLKYFMEAGKMRHAIEYYKKAETEFDKLENASQIVEVGILIQFLTLYDVEKAWEFFEQYAHWAVKSEEYFDFIFSVSVLPLLRETETKVLNMHPSLEWFRGDNTYNIKEIFKFYFKKAKALAQSFDKRNENTYFTEQFAAVL
jgi:tetratricopeptide (TPR) repeat protein